MEFQQALNQTLKDRGIRGIDLAAAIGCTPAQISQLRNGGECTLAFQRRLLTALEEFGAKDHLFTLWHQTEGEMTVRKAINLLQNHDLSDQEVADLLSLASRHIRSSNKIGTKVAASVA